jgi:MFS family permease
MRGLKLLYIATGAMFVHQCFAHMVGLVVPVLAPVIAEELDVGPALIGAYSALLYCSAMVSVTLCGSLFQRFGALRVSQAVLLLMAAGLAIAVPGTLVLFALSAVVIATGPGFSTPAGSHILARYCPPRHAPLFFSIKQTGVPIGGLLAGLLLPFLALRVGWRGAFLATAALFLAFAVVLQPLRAEFDGDRQPGRRVSPADVKATLKAVTTNPHLRELAFASSTFVGLQVCFQAFFVSYLAKGLGWPLTTAGYVFAVSHGVAVFTRILWGWIAGRFVPPRLVLAGLGVAMAAASVATGLYTPQWSLLGLTVVAVFFNATAVSWHGVLFAEIARLAPAAEVGSMTGGVLFFIFVAMVVYPAVFGAILGATGSYAYGFFLGAVPALIAGLLFLRPDRTGGTGVPEAGDPSCPEKEWSAAHAGQVAANGDPHHVGVASHQWTKACPAPAEARPVAASSVRYPA